jgi:hypothetical protein
MREVAELIQHGIAHGPGGVIGGLVGFLGGFQAYFENHPTCRDFLSVVFGQPNWSLLCETYGGEISRLSVPGHTILTLPVVGGVLGIFAGAFLWESVARWRRERGT